MRRIYEYLTLGLLLTAAVSCIENDLSYPYVEAAFSSLELEGQKTVEINAETRTVSIVMGENADMGRVKVLGYTLTNESGVVGGMPEYLDLRDSLVLTLRRYEEFRWTLRAEQPIARYINCENQVGEAVFDLDLKTAYVYVTEDQPLSTVTFNDMKLEPEGSVVKTTKGYIVEAGEVVSKTEACTFPAKPMTLNCAVLRHFYVEYGNTEIEWAVVVRQKALELTVDSVNPWAHSVAVAGTWNEKGTPVFEYRGESDTDWVMCLDNKVDGIKVSAYIEDLTPGSRYLVRLTNGELTSEETEFHTEEAAQIHNMNFDSWSNGDKFPNADGYAVWDSANSTGIVKTTTPVDDAISGKAARLESMNVVMFAAGNIFTGDFLKAVLTGGVGATLDWGTPFTSRPLALRGYYKYSPVAIDYASEKYMELKGQTDQCQILACLTDWAAPFQVNTAAEKFVDFENDPGIIAFAQFNTSEASSEYIQFTLPLVYRSNVRIPSYLIIAAASSRYGDYFTGGKGSVLHVDEFEFIYDPAQLTPEEYETVFGEVKPYWE